MQRKRGIFIDRGRELMWRNKISEEQKALYDEILDALINFKVKTIFSNLKREIFWEAIRAVELDYPEYVFYWNQDDYVYKYRGMEKREVRMKYRYAPETARRKIKDMNEYIERNIIPYVYQKECRTDKEIVAAIYEYLAKRVTYSKNKKKDGSFDFHDYTLETLLNHVGVCQGVAVTMQYILRQYQIDCLCITGYTPEDKVKHPDEATHTWCLVRLDGTFYHLDLTWDLAKNQFLYFLLNDNEIYARRHRWNKKKFPKAG